MATELGFCLHLLQKFTAFWQNNKAPYIEPFLQPVNEANDNAPGYYAQIRQPMDISTMRARFNNGLYTDAAAFKTDFVLMIDNCRAYNKDNQAFVKRYADRFVREFDWEWDLMCEWLAKESRRLRTAAPAPGPMVSAPTAAPIAASAPASAPAPSASSSGSERYVIKFLAWAFSGYTEVSLIDYAFRC
jgi:hypothetical protein